MVVSTWKWSISLCLWALSNSYMSFDAQVSYLGFTFFRLLISISNFAWMRLCTNIKSRFFSPHLKILGIRLHSLCVPEAKAGLHPLPAAPLPDQTWALKGLKGQHDLRQTLVFLIYFITFCISALVPSSAYRPWTKSRAESSAGSCRVTSGALCVYKLATLIYH